MNVSRLLPALLFALTLTACPDDGVFNPGDDGGSGTVEAGNSCTAGSARCFSNDYQVCKDSRWVTKYSCTGGKVCSEKLGRCATCDPGKSYCVGNDIYTCNANGTSGTKVKTCQSGPCVGGQCGDACSGAEKGRSYIGCRYWPVTTLNSTLAGDFAFAVAVANDNAIAAQVSVTRAGTQVATASVPPSGLSTIKLPWVDTIKLGGGGQPEASTLFADGAYFLQSSLPVTVYQFSPLNYVLNSDCAKAAEDPGGKDGKCYSFSNDASLLLPEHVLTKEYMVIARPSMGLKMQAQLATSPGFAAVVAVKDGTTQVKATFSANTQAGLAGSLKAYTKGQTGTFSLKKGSVLQLVSRVPTSCTATSKDPRAEFCDLGTDTDLTGTMISADKELAVFSGHNCALIPYNKWACDHLEEQLFPLKSWGKHYVGAHVASSKTDPSVFRVVSAEDKNSISFSPAVNKTVTLNKGQFVEFVSSQDFEVKGSGRLALVHYMVGQNYSNTNPGQGAPGDPAMALAVPVEQYRTSYRFLAPTSFQQNYVNIKAPLSATVKLDGQPVNAAQFKTVGSTGHKVAKIAIVGGTHTVQSSSKVGIAVYGVGSYTSYMYAGGLDLKLLY